MAPRENRRPDPGPALGPVLVLGRTGMLGRAVAQALAARNVRHDVADRGRVDLARAQSFTSGIPSGTSAVINCTGWTNVDAAESQEEEATRINGHAVGQLAERCKQLGAVLIHYSTDYVFSGDATEPYAVDHPRKPLNAYGRSKAVGEELLEQSGAEYLLIRTSWVYAPWGKNFVRTIVGAAQKRPTLRVVNDQLGRPSSAEQLAETSLDLLGAGARGTFHGTDAGACTWFELARAAVQLSGASAQVEPCSSSEYPSPARRPSYSVLDLSRTEALIGARTPWQTSLASVIPRLGD